MIVIGIVASFVIAILLSQVSWTERGSVHSPPPRSEATDGLKVSEDWIWPEKENDGRRREAQTVVLIEPREEIRL